MDKTKLIQQMEAKSSELEEAIFSNGLQSEELEEQRESLLWQLDMVKKSLATLKAQSGGGVLRRVAGILFSL